MVTPKIGLYRPKLLRILGPLDRVMAILVTPPIGGNDFFNTRTRRDMQKSFIFLPGANLGGFGLLRNVGKSTFESMGQAGVFPELWPF